MKIVAWAHNNYIKGYTKQYGSDIKGVAISQADEGPFS